MKTNSGSTGVAAKNANRNFKCEKCGRELSKHENVLCTDCYIEISRRLDDLERQRLYDYNDRRAHGIMD